MCERTVSEESTSVAAISSVDWPVHRRSRTSHSRGGEPAAHRADARAVRARAPHRVDQAHRQPARDDGLAGDRAAQRARQRVDAGALVEEPRGAGAQAHQADSSSSDDVRITISTSGSRARISRVAWMPSTSGHHEVHEDDVRLVVQAQLDRFAAVGRLRDDDDPPGFERVADDTARQRVIVGDDHAQRGA